MRQQELHRILLVEDEVDIQMVARLALEDIGGFEVEVCGSGEEALERAPQWAPQLVLLDIMLPGIDGLTTFARMAKDPRLCHIPVVFMTARAQLAEMEEYRLSGAIDVIVKPFDAMKLADDVHTIWRRHRVVAGAP